MKLVLGRNMEGLRLYDDDMKLFVDVTWDVDTAKDGTWSEPAIIPPRQQIIGAKVAYHENWIRAITWMLGPDY